MDTPLEPAVAALVAEIMGREPADRDAVPIEVMRATSDEMLERLTGPRPACAVVEDVAIAGAAGPLPSRRYRPAGEREVWDTLLFFHGGGFTIGNLDTHDMLARVLAEEAGCQVISVGYRLAPEHPYPAAHEDARAAADWLPPGGAVAVFGDSAGGSLALAAARRLRERGRAPVFQALAYPVVDCRAETDAYVRHAADGFLSTEACRWFFRQLMPRGGDLTHPDLSPLLAPDLAENPPTIMLLAGVDPLVDDGRAYARALTDAGVACELHEYPDQTHGFLGMAAITSRAREGLAEVARAVRGAFDAQGLEGS
jgi:acetyl esterase